MRLILVCALIALVPSAFSATNEYYTSPKAKALIDQVIQAYGGAKKLAATERVKLRMEMKHSASPLVIEATIHQTRKALKRERRIGDKWDAHVFDGTNAFLASPTGTAAGNAKLKQELAREVAEGPGQAAFAWKFLNQTNHVRYAGETERGGAKYEAIETLDAEGDKVAHYFDPQTHREIFRFKHKRAGQEVQSFEAFQEFGGVLYPTKITMRAADGTTMTAELREVSDKFDDSVFRVSEK